MAQDRERKAIPRVYKFPKFKFLDFFVSGFKEIWLFGVQLSVGN